jgi:hypothetical protein
MPKHFCLRAKPPSSDIFLLRGQVLNSITECILVKQLVNKVPLVILQKWIYYWTRVPTERMGKYISNFNSLTLLQYLSNPFIQSVNFQFSDLSMTLFR